MIKLKTAKKHIIGDENESEDIKLSLVKKDIHTRSGKCEYSIISETDTDLSIMYIGKNSTVADLVFDIFLENDVTPENLEDIAYDYELTTP